MINLRGIHPDTLRADFKQAGQKSYLYKQVMNWVYQHHRSSFDAMHTIAKPARAWLSERYTLDEPVVVDKQVAADDSAVKYVLALADGQRIETVLLREKSYNTLCVSSQCGCGIGCTFCLTGTLGFGRQLQVAEIVGQVTVVCRDAPISRIVFMGMGEPLANIEAVVTAIAILNHPDAVAIGKRKITVSTSGILPGISYLTKHKIVLNLAFSVGHADPAKRLSIMPIEKTMPILDVATAIKAYQALHNRQLTLEYTLLKSINDDAGAIQALGRLAKYLQAKVNLINLNPHPAIPYEPVSRGVLYQCLQALQSDGVYTTIRHPKGDDIIAACGQLGLVKAGAVLN